VLERGGMVASIEDGFIQREISDSAAAYQAGLENKSEFIVGVNCHVDPDDVLPFEQFQLDPTLGDRQMTRTRSIRAHRDGTEHAAALREIEQAAKSGDNTMPSVVRAINASATVGEICDVMRGVYGEYTAPIVY
jgi:methylmalonyl-CoA mutase N-terminal domain/subunit